MKKLLGLLGAIGLVATSSATVVACGPDTTSDNNDNTDTGVITGIDANIAYKKDLTKDDLIAAVKTANSTPEDTETVKSEVTFYGAGSTLSIDENGVITGAEEATGIAMNTTYVFAIKTSTTATTEADDENGDATTTTTYTLTVGNMNVGAPVITPDNTDPIDFTIGGESNTKTITINGDSDSVGTLVASCDGDYSLTGGEENNGITSWSNDYISVVKNDSAHNFTVSLKQDATIAGTEAIKFTLSIKSSDVENVTPIDYAVTIHPAATL
jgi:hypothetical protein